jgi:nitrite reductase/ring-hydroxylating ferredoxin subunit
MASHEPGQKARTSDSTNGEELTLEHHTQVAVIRQLLDGLKSGQCARAEQVSVSPASSYTDPDLARREYEELFHNTPQLIGLSCEIPEAGSYITTEDFGIPILAVRDKAGTFRAFLNACRHRGAQVVTKARGKQPRFTCPYHGWSYGQDGSLLNVRSAEQFGEIDKACNSLIELPSQEKYGLLYVHPNREGVIDIDAFLGAEFAEEIASYELEKCVFRDEVVLDEKFNWKIANDTFCEPYHFGVLHHKTAAAFIHGDVTEYREFDRHHRMTVPTKAIDAILSLPESEWVLTKAAIIAYYVFPNLNPIFQSNILNFSFIYPDPAAPYDPGRSRTRLKLYQADHILPGAAEMDDSQRLTGENVYAPDASKPLVFDVSGSKQNYVTAIAEDYLMGSQLQKAASSGKVERLIFGRNEPGLHHVHNGFRQALGMPKLEPYKD